MIKRTALILLPFVVGIQFYRPEKHTLSPGSSQDDFIARHEAPSEVRRLFSVACYDCHSNQTHYPWYAEIQPLGWWLAKHIEEGRDSLDLSPLGGASAKKQAKRIDAMIAVIPDRSMPLPSYTWIHRDANLDEKNIKLLTDWLGQIREKLGVDQ